MRPGYALEPEELPRGHGRPCAAARRWSLPLTGLLWLVSIPGAGAEPEPIRQPAPDATAEPQRPPALASPIPPARLELDGTEIVVQMAAAGKLDLERGLSPGEILVGGPREFGGAVAEAATESPVAAVAMVIAGAILIVAGPPLSMLFGAKRRAAVEALTAEPLPQLTLDALAMRLRGQPPPSLPPRIEVDIIGYGLVPEARAPDVFSQGDRMCLVAEALVAATRDGHERIAAPMEIAVDPELRSDDAPLPLCASLERFTAKDGEYLRQAVRELAQVLAAMTLARLETLE